MTVTSHLERGGSKSRSPRACSCSAALFFVGRVSYGLAIDLKHPSPVRGIEAHDPLRHKVISVSMIVEVV